MNVSTNVTRLDPWGHARPGVRACHHHRISLYINIMVSYRTTMAMVLADQLAAATATDCHQSNFAMVFLQE